MSKTILVTGATGFIGSWLAEKLIKRGDTVRALVRPSSDKTNLAGMNIEYVNGDYKNVASLRKAVEGVDEIYHVAGVTKAKDEQGYIDGNVTATENLLQAALEANPSLKRFLHTSSGTVTGPAATAEKPVDETAVCKPLTTYGRTKLMAEDVCHRYSGKLPVTIVRPPAVYGERDRDVLEFFRTVKNGLQPMVGFGITKRISLVHASDLTDGMMLACDAPNAAGQIYFISSEKTYTWHDVGEAASKALGKSFVLKLKLPEWAVFGIATVAESMSGWSDKPALINREKAIDMVQNFWTFSTEKAMRDLGYREHLTLETGIRQTVEWYVKNKWL